MAQPLYQPDLPTDAYGATNPAPRPVPTPTLSPRVIMQQKKMAGISAAALLLGGGVGLVMANRTTDMGDTSALTNPTGTDGLPPTTTEPTSVLPAEFDAAGKVTDQMTFKQAFQAARDEVGVGGVFNWHGRWYNTFERDEWSGLSLEQRQEYVEMLTGEKLPIKPYYPSATSVVSQSPGQPEEVVPDPILIEGYLSGQRVMGLDVDHDGTIDALVLEGSDGYTYRVVDESGNDGLDMLYRYDPLNGELREIEKIDEPFILTNDQFSQNLEASMAQDVIDSVLETDVPPPPAAPEPVPEIPAAPEATYPPAESPTGPPVRYVTETYKSDDTYINNGDVHDMDH